MKNKIPPRPVPKRISKHPHHSHAPLYIILIAVAVFIIWALIPNSGDQPEVPQPTSTPMQPICGNGVIEPGEMCEFSNFQGATCESEGFIEGRLRCVSCKIVTDGCVKTTKGTVEITSSPPGQIIINDQPYGVSPQTLELEAGGYNLLIEKADYITYEKSFTVTAGRESQVIVALAESPKPKTQLNLIAYPPGASVFINQTPYGNTPVNISALPPGDYALLITYPGYRFRGQIVELEDGETEEIFAVLSRN